MEDIDIKQHASLEDLEKRIQNLESGNLKSKHKQDGNEHPILTNKETEDLFKIAFRNYNHLISVADSKAALLIRVNSVVISIIIAFLVGKGGRSLSVHWPALVLLGVSLITIMLSILASRPQNSRFVEDSKSRSYQRFFFGSFDMVDNGFLKVNWEGYFKQLTDLFMLPKETVYLEIYKESYNVRQVIAKKFDYLSKAYWVFLFGFFISVVSFVIAEYRPR